MASPTEDAVDTFIAITGASMSVAIQKLEEHGGDLNAAVNSHFNEGDREIACAPSPPGYQNDNTGTDDPMDVDHPGPSFPLFAAAARGLSSFSLFSSRFGARLFDSAEASPLSSREPHVSHPRDVRVIPIEFKEGNDQNGSSAHGPIIEDVTGSISAGVPEVHGNVIIDEEDEDFPSAPPYRSDDIGDSYVRRHPGPVGVYDIEEEMIKAAIEASKLEAEEFGSSSSMFDVRLPASEDDDFAQALSMSMKTAEQERALRELGVQIVEQSSNLSGRMTEEIETVATDNGRQGFFPSENGATGTSVIQDDDLSDHREAEDEEEEQLVRQRPSRVASRNARPQQHHNIHQPDWRGLSSEEHDDAFMLEAAIFGGIPEMAYPPHGGVSSSANFYPREPRPPSPTLTSQRLLREQQDDEYLAALQADKEKELKATQEEAAAREAALEKEKLREKEARRKVNEEEEFERKLASKQASLPQEPSPADENAVTLLIRMPDGSRCGRRFLKSDKLQVLFDYIDVERLVKPGTYRLVRPYPRQVFTAGESASTLNELGFTNKQEALFLELI